MRVGSEIGEIQTSPEARIIAQIVPQATNWKDTLAKRSSRKIRKDLENLDIKSSNNVFETITIKFGL